MKKTVSNIMLLILIPALVIFGALIFKDKSYAFVSAAVALLACFSFFTSFERKEHDTAKLIIISVMTALSVVGRILFAVIPAFKPVTAMVILTALYFGREAGFMCGALSAVISNFYFGQGPWTPFQMLTWGIIGFIAGLMAGVLKKNYVVLGVFAALSGFLFSALMDIWTVLWADGTFNFSRYLATALGALPTAIIYAISNTLFLLILLKPADRIFNRIKVKYGI